MFDNYRGTWTYGFVPEVHGLAERSLNKSSRIVKSMTPSSSGVKTIGTGTVVAHADVRRVESRGEDSHVPGTRQEIKSLAMCAWKS